MNFGGDTNIQTLEAWTPLPQSQVLKQDICPPGVSVPREREEALFVEPPWSSEALRG